VSKRINEPITLRRSPSLFDRNHIPTQFTWRGRDYRVQAIGGEWRILGRWWDGEGERHYFRAITPQGLAMDLCHDMQSGAWTLYELQD